MAQATSPSRHDVAPVRRRPKPLPWPLNIYQTAIGKKYAMALTGIGLLGFVVVHMIGNLHLYEGPRQVHEYAEVLPVDGDPNQAGPRGQRPREVHEAVRQVLLQHGACALRHLEGRFPGASRYATETLLLSGKNPVVVSKITRPVR